MRITGGLVFDLEKGFFEKDLCTDGAVIASESTDETVINASGCYVIPGLVDVHFHGCVGGAFRLWQIMNCPREWPISVWPE